MPLLTAHSLFPHIAQGSPVASGAFLARHLQIHNLIPFSCSLILPGAFGWAELPLPARSTVAICKGSEEEEGIQSWVMVSLQVYTCQKHPLLCAVLSNTSGQTFSHLPSVSYQKSCTQMVREAETHTPTPGAELFSLVPQIILL